MFETGQKVWDWLDELESGKVTGGSLPDFALMDIRMPGRRGNEIAGRMREVDKLKHIPIVLMTAFVLSEEEIDRLRQDFGVDHVINKPLPDFDRLGVILHDIIKKKQSQPAPQKVAEAAAPAAPSIPTPPAPPVASAPAPTPIPPTPTPPAAPSAAPSAPSAAPSKTPPAGSPTAPPTAPVKPVAPTPSPSEPTRQHPIQKDDKPKP
jgi:CheY-like chemotaxis protein